MADFPNSAARHCPRCGRAATPRGADPPRFCTVCGQRLVPLHTEVQRSFAGQRVASRAAVAAFILGLCAYAPVFGSPCAGLAVVFALAAFNHIGRSGGRLSGRGFAFVGLMLGGIRLLVMFEGIL